MWTEEGRGGREKGKEDRWRRDEFWTEGGGAKKEEVGGRLGNGGRRENGGAKQEDVGWRHCIHSSALPLLRRKRSVYAINAFCKTV